jgi:DNA end-binding protein Ku
MSEHTLWRGTLRLALVSCPVALISTRNEKNNLHFNMINPQTGNRIRMLTTDAGTGDEVDRGDLVRGYEFSKGEYVLLSDEDFESARIDSSSTLTIAKFVPLGSIGPLHFDAGYYLAPDGEEGLDVYAVLRDALAQSRMVALSRIVLFRRERAVAILPLENGMLLQTLHEEGDLHSATDAFQALDGVKADPAMVKLARQLIERQAGDYIPSDTEDRYEARLRQLIEAKAHGEGLEPEQEEEPRGGNVIDLMLALKNSLRQQPGAAASGTKPATKTTARDAKPAGKASKAAAKKPAAKAAPAKAKGTKAPAKPAKAPAKTTKGATSGTARKPLRRAS